jgi:hypothetical protein
MFETYYTPRLTPQALGATNIDRNYYQVRYFVLFLTTALAAAVRVLPVAGLSMLTRLQGAEVSLSGLNWT